ncbi:DUF2797 domain-containing protein [Methylophaga sp. OBS3]|uniref:DUF2797 domain-containing protein n=1 Tax=Methylophaga sp. OBS3 TaxID=2991934 RepID=UPI0022500478|nr:DUF2797 domain-containing protein [Methylophaga sp. OBS3]MCX4189576.1 DUF2797 domain-containing protein [Methylophaga sp. OBS3]
MRAVLPADGQTQYQLHLADNDIAMHDYIGKSIRFDFLGAIHCQNCQRKTNKSYSGGFCFPCSQKLAQCDLCFMKPETCHYDEGTCREPDWGLSVCMQDHVVYLANSSGLKVGITRIGQVPTRWLDQGATQALPIFKVKSRYQSGLVEVLFKQHVADRTDWRKMLKGDAEPLDLAAQRDRLFEECAAEIETLQKQFPDGAITPLTAENVVTIRYPVDNYPEKIKALNFDKTPALEGILQGIKGQYLILDTGVLNIRKFAGYQVAITL